MPRMEARSCSSFPRGFPIRREAIKEEMREEEEQGREMQGEAPAWKIVKIIKGAGQVATSEIRLIRTENLPVRAKTPSMD